MLRSCCTLLILLLPFIYSLDITTKNPFINQDSTSIPFDQCPCFKTSSGYKCIQYDTRYQATSLEEAIFVFDDLTFDKDEGTPEILSSEVSTDCHTADCVKCQEDIQKRLYEIGMISNVTLPISNNSSVICQRYRFSKDSSTEYKYGEEKEKKEKESGDSSSEEKKEEKEEKKKEKEKCKCRKERRRFRRQVTQPIPSVSNVSMIGTRFNLSCTQKGIDLDGTGVVSLCNKCWSWRKLPSNYFPQYVNELVCDTLNTDCLSGFGGCSIGTRSIEVYRTDINQTVTLTAGAFCECKVFSNSALLRLVNGTSQEGQTILDTLAG